MIVTHLSLSDTMKDKREGVREDHDQAKAERDGSKHYHVLRFGRSMWR